MGYAILRIQKLKSAVAVHRSMKHAFREQDTPNADSERTPTNDHHGASSSREAMAAFRARLPESFRKDAVQAVEYLITASPEDMKGKSRAGQDAYFGDALTWLKAKHGAENVVYAGVHRDETTPHMYAYVVPRVGDKLNARAFFGGAKALSTMQTDFAQKVGRKHGLERGLEGSKAHHRSIRDYYANVQAATPPKPSLELPEPTMGDRMNPKAYGAKVVDAMLAQINPSYTAAKAKAVELDAAKAAAKAAREGHEKLTRALRPVVAALTPLNQDERELLASRVSDISRQMVSDKLKAKEIERQRGEFDRRAGNLAKLADRSAGPAHQFAIAGLEAIRAAGGHANRVDWPAVELAAARASIANKQPPDKVMEAISKYSPGMAKGDRLDEVRKAIAAIPAPRPDPGRGHGHGYSR